MPPFHLAKLKFLREEQGRFMTRTAFKVTSSVLLTVGFTVLGTTQAWASSSDLTCSAGTVTANPLARGSAVSYSQCLGPVEGNDVKSKSKIDNELTDFLNTYLGDWTLDAKFEGGKATSDSDNQFGFSWKENQEGEGTWDLTQAVNRPFVISLKAGNHYSSYYVDGAGSTSGGSWATFDGKELSHASFFVAKGSSSGDQPPAAVPEPGTSAALMLVGLSVVGIAKRR
jgi:hypothetical protein